MFFGAPSQVVPPVASVPSNSENQFPAGLPGQNGGLPLPSPDVHTSDAGNSNFMPPVGSMDSGQVGMANDETSFAPPLNVDNDEPVVLSLPGLGDSTSPAVALPPVTEASVEDDLVSGERGGIAAMREQGSSLLNSSAVDVQEVLDRIKELEEKFETRISSLMSDIDARFSDFEVKGSVISSNTPDDFDGVDEVISDGTSKRSIDLYAKPPLKPSIIEDMALKGVSRGLAWVETPSGIVEVRVGENISGAGRVLAVKEYNGTWMALTENGLILR